MDHSVFKAPRLYYPHPLGPGAGFTLEGPQHHYLRNVMRRQAGDVLRLFNPGDGEWAVRIAECGKKAVTGTVEAQIRTPEASRGPAVTLCFSPLPKDRMDMLVEKAVELGVAALQPLVMEFSSVRKVNEDRITAQIVEAAEQSERLDIPGLLPIRPFAGWLAAQKAPFVVALERAEAVPLGEAAIGGMTDCAFLIGPEGGFSDGERKALTQHEMARCVTLGPRILRAETAAMAGLSLLLLSR